MYIKPGELISKHSCRTQMQQETDVPSFKRTFSVGKNGNLAVAPSQKSGFESTSHPDATKSGHCSDHRDKTTHKQPEQEVLLLVGRFLKNERQFVEYKNNKNYPMYKISACSMLCDRYIRCKPSSAYG